MDCDERLGSVYGKILNVLEEALFWLERPPAEGPDVHDAQRSGMFHLGVAGGLAFSGCLPGIKSEALFDDISDAAEKLDLDQVGRQSIDLIRTVVPSLVVIGDWLTELCSSEVACRQIIEEPSNICVRTQRTDANLMRANKVRLLHPWCAATLGH